MNTFQESISARLEIYDHFKPELEMLLESPKNEETYTDFLIEYLNIQKKLKKNLKKAEINY